MAVATKAREQIYSLSHPQNATRRWRACSGTVLLWILHKLRWARSWRRLRTRCGITNQNIINNFSCQNIPLCLFLRKRERLRIQQMVLCAMEYLDNHKKGMV